MHKPGVLGTQQGLDLANMRRSVSLSVVHLPQWRPRTFSQIPARRAGHTSAERPASIWPGSVSAVSVCRRLMVRRLGRSNGTRDCRLTEEVVMARDRALRVSPTAIAVRALD
jgi:hypothetical protein